MAGYNGLGINKKATTSGGGLYSLVASDVVNGEMFVREDFLNKTIIAKTSITDYYIAIFFTDIGKDGDFIAFKNVDDALEYENPSAYLEFYDVDWDGQIFVPTTWGHYLENDNAEIMFVKEGDKWRRLNNTGLFKIDEDPDPMFDQQDLYFDWRNIVFKGQLFFMEGINGDFGNYTKVMRLYPDKIEIHQNIKPAPSTLIDLGSETLRFGTLYAASIDISDGIPTTLENDLTPKLAADLDLNSKNIFSNGNALAIKGNADLVGTGGLMYFQVASDLYLQFANKVIGLFQNMEPDGSIATETLDIGNSSKRFRTLYAKDGNLVGKLQLGESTVENYSNGIKFNSDGGSHNFFISGALIFAINGTNMNIYKSIIPASNGLLDIGGSATRMRNIWAKTLQLQGGIGVDVNESYDLGSTISRFRTLYAKNIVLTESPFLEATGIHEDLLPLSNGVYNLGSQALKFNANLLNATIDNLNVNNDVRPLENDRGNLGISSKRWTNVYTKSMDIENGATGTFTSNDGKTVTVTKGIITSIV